MVALFWYNSTEWIGDRQCFVSNGAAYNVATGVAGEVDVAMAWKEWSLYGMIFWGLAIVAQIIYVVAGCIAQGGEAGQVTAVPIQLCGCCVWSISGICLVVLTIWGSMLRFSDEGNLATQDFLPESGLAMLIINIVHYIIVLIPCVCLAGCCACALCCAGMVAGAAAAGDN